MAKNSDSCFYCGKPATKLCDGRTETGTCDRPMCQNCVAHQGLFIACGIRGKNKKRRSHADTVDYCRDCAAKRSVSVSIQAAVQASPREIRAGDRVSVWHQTPPFTPDLSPERIAQLAQNPWAFPVDLTRPKFRCWGDWAIVVLKRQQRNGEVWLIVTSDQFPEPLRSQGVRVPATHVELVEAGYGLPESQAASAPKSQPIQVKQEALF